MPVVIDQVVGQVEPEPSQPESIDQPIPTPQALDALILRQQTRQLQQRAARLRAD